MNGMSYASGHRVNKTKFTRNNLPTKNFGGRL